MTLSGYWASGSHRALAGATSDASRLAIALTPVRSIIRVVDDSDPPATVDWCQVGRDEHGEPMSMSYTRFGEQTRIAVNPLPVLDRKISAGAAIDVVSGFALHEASHAKHSRDRWQHLIRKEIIGSGKKPGVPETREVPAFEPMKIAAYLYNLAEDVRIERETSREWPGFAAYFNNLLDWMWTEHIGKGMDDLTYGPKVADRIKVVFAAIRYPEKMAEWTAGHESPDIAAESAWWQAWQADYLSGTTDVPTTIRRGLDHLGDDPETRKEMDELAEQERREREAGEKIRAQIERLMAEGITGVPMVCVTSEGDVRALTAQEAADVERLVKEGLISITPIIEHRGAAAPPIRHRKPSETPASRRAYVGKPDAMVEAMRTALAFRPELPRYDVKLQRRGEMDDEELWRSGTGDDRVFSERIIEQRPEVLLGLLVDLSGSMMGDIDGRSKIEIAQRLAQVFVWATHDREGVTTQVWGHSGDDPENGSDIYTLWEPGDPLRRLGLISDLEHGDNYDGYALQYALDQMRNQPQPQKVLIVLSDGYPAGHGYGGVEARDHMRAVTKWGESQGVTTIQLAIDSSLRPKEQAEMYGANNWLPFTSEHQLPRDLTRLLMRFAK